MRTLRKDIEELEIIKKKKKTKRLPMEGRKYRAKKRNVRKKQKFLKNSNDINA